MNRQLLTTKQVADVLSVGRTTVFKLLNQKELAAVLIGSRRLIISASVRAYICRQLEREGFAPGSVNLDCGCSHNPAQNLGVKNTTESEISEAEWEDVSADLGYEGGAA